MSVEGVEGKYSIVNLFLLKRRPSLISLQVLKVVGFSLCDKSAKAASMAGKA